MRILLAKGQVYGPISGSDETLVTYATQLRRTGHEVSVLLMYLHSESDQYYQRLLDGNVPVTWIASSLAHTSMGMGRKIAYKIFNTFPKTRRFIRKRSLRVVTRLARHHYKQCRKVIEERQPDLVHVMTPDPNAMVIIEAATDCGVPVIYQELGIPYHPPDFESYYEQFTSVLPLCAQVAALSPRLIDHCREALTNSVSLCILPIMSDETTNGVRPRRSVADKINFGFAARMEEMKGTMVLLEAFAATHRQHPAIMLSM